MAELRFKSDVFVFVASVGSHFPQALRSPSRGDAVPESPPRGGGRGIEAHLARMGRERRREQPDAVAISGQMKPDPVSA